MPPTMTIFDIADHALAKYDEKRLEGCRAFPGTLVVPRELPAQTVAEIAALNRSEIIIVEEKGRLCGLALPAEIRRRIAKHISAGEGETFVHVLALMAKQPAEQQRSFRHEFLNSMNAVQLFRCDRHDHYVVRLPCPYPP